MIFKSLDRQLWKQSGHNPDAVLRQIPFETLESAAANPDFIRNYDEVMVLFREEMGQKESRILKDAHLAQDQLVAYFSAEYGLHHSLPFYAGGLGFLAGDFVKECSDCNIPLYRRRIHVPSRICAAENSGRTAGRKAGTSISTEKPLPSARSFIHQVKIWWSKSRLSIPPYLSRSGESTSVESPCICWDTDHEINDPWNRSISSRLYVGDMEQRLRQEIVLGIGGSEVLENLGIRHSVLHLNEGHAAFAILERN